MKRLLFCLLGSVVLPCYVGAQQPTYRPAPADSRRIQHPPPAFSGTIWTTITRPVPNGTSHITVQRTELARDAAGNWTQQFHKPTNGPQYDVSAPLINTAAGKTPRSLNALVPSQTAGEVLERDEDLGTRADNGIQIVGRRRTFVVAGSEPPARHTLETWYSPSLSTVTQTENHNPDGSVINSVLVNVRTGDAAAPLPTSTPAEPVASTRLSLYRGLFSIIAQMERARLAEKAETRTNLSKVEQGLQAKLGLSEREWLLLAATAARVDDDNLATESRVRSLAHGQLDAPAQSRPSADTWRSTLTTIGQMRTDLQVGISTAIDKLEGDEGLQATAKIRAFLEGPLAASAKVIYVKRDGGGPR